MSDLDTALRAAAERIANAGENTDDVMQAFMQVQARDISKLTPAEWFARFAYVTTTDGFFDLVTRRFIHRKTFDAMFRHVKTNSVHDGKPCRPSVAFDESRYAMNGLMASGVTYAPGMGSLCARQGSADCNIWLDGRPKGIPGDVTPWLRHFERLFPDRAMREHVANVMAHKVQRPNIKINSGILLAGAPGCGKDSLFAPWLWAVGGNDLRNIAICRSEDVISAFNYSIESEIMIINELRMNAGAESRALENFLKPVLAAPPELIPVNKKQEHPYLALNRTLVVAFSNEKRPITISPDDRRWFVHWTDAPRMTETEADALWNWYGAGGREHVADWLATRDLAGFNPNAAPMMTPGKAALLRVADYDVHRAIMDLAQRRQPPFSKGLIASPWPSFARVLEAELIARGIRAAVPADVLQAAVTEAGWVNRGKVAAAGLARRAVFVDPQHPVAGMLDSDLRRAAEREWPQALQAVQ